MGSAGSRGNRKKFHENHSIHCGHVGLSWFSKWRPPPSWIFEIQIFKRSRRLRDPFCIILPNFAKIGQSVAVISRFLWFSRLRPPPFWISKIRNFNGLAVPCRWRICVTVPNFITIGQTVAEIWRFNGFFFQNGGRPPSWISNIQIF